MVLLPSSIEPQLISLPEKKKSEESCQEQNESHTQLAFSFAFSHWNVAQCHGTRSDGENPSTMERTKSGRGEREGAAKRRTASGAYRDIGGADDIVAHLDPEHATVHAVGVENEVLALELVHDQALLQVVTVVHGV